MNSYCRYICLPLLAAMVLSIAGPDPAAGQQPSSVGVQGVLRTADRELQGRIRWLPMAREYEVTAESGVTITISGDRVVAVDVPRPGGIEEAVNDVRRDRPSAAIPVLERIAEQYAWLRWDIPATRWLAEAHLANNDAEAAVRACEALVRGRAELAYNSEMAPVYWRALLQLDRRDRLERFLQRAMGTGDRALVARALVMRGDMLRSTGEYRNALKDGYLRVILLMGAERDVVPEALYRAIACFNELGEVSHAERMRTRLMSDYAQSEFAQKVRTGG